MLNKSRFELGIDPVGRGRSVEGVTDSHVASAAETGARAAYDPAARRRLRVHAMAAGIAQDHGARGR